MEQCEGRSPLFYLGEASLLSLRRFTIKKIYNLDKKKLLKSNHSLLKALINLITHAIFKDLN